MSENTHSTSKNLADEMARRRGRRYPAHTWIAEKFPDYVKVLVELDEVIRLKPRRFDQKMHELFHIVALAVEMSNPPNQPHLKQHIKQGRMRALGVMSLKPVSQLPGVPTVSETLSGFENEGWWPLMAPAGTPKAVVEKIQRDVAKVMKASDVGARLQQLALDPVGSTPEEFARQLKEETERWGKIVRQRKLQAN